MQRGHVTAPRWKQSILRMGQDGDKLLATTMARLNGSISQKVSSSDCCPPPNCIDHGELAAITAAAGPSQPA